MVMRTGIETAEVSVVGNGWNGVSERIWGFPDHRDDHGQAITSRTAGKGGSYSFWLSGSARTSRIRQALEAIEAEERDRHSDYGKLHAGSGSERERARFPH